MLFDKLKSNNRSAVLDIVRSILMLWIIGAWHMISYVNLGIKNNFTSKITTGAVATFFFISGLLLSKNSFADAKEVMKFYKKRFIRLWPMLFVFSTMFLIVRYVADFQYITGVKQYLLTIFGVSALFNCEGKTIWFASLIFFFYLITPLIVFSKSRIKRTAASLVIFAVFIVLFLFFNSSKTLVIYFPVYALGLILGINEKIFEKKWFVYVISALISSALFVAAFNLYNKNKMLVFNYVFILCTIAVIFSLACLLKKIGRLYGFWYFVSYGSFVAYLFHRLFFGVLLYGYERFGFGQKIHWSLMYFILFPMLLLISYYIQYFYDKICVKLSK